MKPTLAPYTYHALMCCGNSCGENLPLFNYLKERTAENSAVRVNRAGCLDVCMEGPIMVVYPDGVWYCQLNKDAIDRIVDRHFGQGTVVEELAFYKAG